MNLVPKWKCAAIPRQANRSRDLPMSVELVPHLALVPDPGAVSLSTSPSLTVLHSVNYSVIRVWRRCPRGLHSRSIVVIWLTYFSLVFTECAYVVCITVGREIMKHTRRWIVDPRTMDTTFLGAFRNRLIQALFRSIPRQQSQSACTEYSVHHSVLPSYETGRICVIVQ